MTADDCAKLVQHWNIIAHVAGGGYIQHAMHNVRGELLGWSKPTRKVLIPCLGAYRIVPMEPKPRIRLSAEA